MSDTCIDPIEGRTSFENLRVPLSGTKSELHRDGAQHFYFQLAGIDHHTIVLSFLQRMDCSSYLSQRYFIYKTHRSLLVANAEVSAPSCKNAGFLHKSTGKKTALWQPQLITLPSNPFRSKSKHKMCRGKRSTRPG